MQNNYQQILFIICTIFISACNFTPKYKRDLAIFEQKEKLGRVEDSEITIDELSQWWRKLDDPVSERLVNELLSKNLSLQEAAERLYQVHEMAKVAGAQLLPAVELNALTSQTRPDGQIAQDLVQTNFSVSWQIDLFGKIRAAKNSARNLAKAQQYNLQALTHSLIAELINKRISIYLTHQSVIITKLNLDDAKSLLSLVTRKYELGAKNINISDLYFAKSNYEEAKRELSRAERLLATEISGLEILLAKMPGTLMVRDLISHISAPKPIQEKYIAASLLDRRPDLKAVESRLLAANADVGVAIADLFPNFVINANVTNQDTKFDQLFSVNNMTTSILANMITKIFAGGALQANVKIQKSKAKELSLQYARKIYQAVGEVETNLKADYHVIMEYRMSQTNAKLYERSKKYSKNRYLRGVEKLSNYLDSKRKAYLAMQHMIEAEKIMWKQRIALYLSLGGHWIQDKKIKNK